MGVLLLLSAGAAGPELAPTGYGVALFKMLGALVLVCLLAYVALRLLRNQLTGRAGQGGLLRVVERCPLGARQSLWIVEVGERVFLIASTDGAVSKLAELDREVVRQAAAAPRKSFREILLGVRGDVPKKSRNGDVPKKSTSEDVPKESSPGGEA